MNFDFNLLLVPVFFITAICWVAGKFWFKKAKFGNKFKRILVQPTNFIGELFPIVFIVLVIRSFLFEPYQIPSGSMKPTLKIGDFILVNKFYYGVKVPLSNQTIIPVNEAQRGDVIVFRFPQDPNIRYIKRVIGLPGDEIIIDEDGIITVNDEQIIQTALNRYLLNDDGEAIPQYQIYQESLNDNNYSIAKSSRSSFFWNSGQGAWEVPPGHYFVMGDNRDNSNDSRFWGFVPQNDIIGRALLVWLHWDKNTIPDFSVRMIK